jgi:hypothetical protein
VVENKDLSPTTKKNYRESIAALCKRASMETCDFSKFVLDKKNISMIGKWYTNPSSQKMHFTTILGLFRHNPVFKEAHKEVYDAWYDAFQKAHAKVVDRYESNEPSERQKEGYVPYEKIIQVRDGLDTGDIRKLLLDMYTYIKPMRCEYARIALYRNKVPMTGTVEPNYILIKGQNGKLIINKYKTAKTLGMYELDVPSEVMKDLLKSLETDSRDWLFVKKDKTPFSTNMYTQWTTKIFRDLFKKPLTVALIRHAYINTIDFNTMSIKDKREIANSMGQQSVETQDRYRLLFDTKKEACECDCKAK